MNETAKKFMNMSLWSVLIIFVLRCLIGWSEIAQIKQNAELIKGFYTFFGYAGEAIGTSAIVMAVFNKWGWKWKPLNFLAGGMPVLEKKYKGKIRFIWEGKEQERDSQIIIIQTFLKVVVKLGTAESSSNSITATIIETNNENQLIYTYENTPRAELQNRSAIHYGTAMLKVDDPKHLTGNYYTGRLSRGSMDFWAVSEK